ncbi:hypothetical protein Pmar_PMAR020003 [Perkinsus marinus ATCC 50983]|uniref:IPT/TIG domain-containing protein n=1 Tax=Perkinsus marinus (strain ATCC 50983 / TXsc) TaxID=423536 RepID=C5LJA9_PERM5|nr:hypothetical protein Pmar_PMAR020003 [Perkinsus marinus ATCC 50983]EER03225.1 hypothetical protein Pmar_PMAR020003 [Perkinsus marinus ATCC 50983]|eukprot:XP_002771409.1 hypothetical protein Pmar_PMAR020003 [Perkinsus marinus ATCC 50983]
MPVEEPPLNWLKHNVSLKAVVPDWSFHNGGGIVVLTGKFVPPSIFNFSAILVNFGRGGPRASATLMNESAINCTVPAMPDNFFDTVLLSVTVVFLSPFNSTHVNITAQGPGLVFSYLPNLALGSLVPRTGPPGGLTNVTMRVMFFANSSSGLERDLGLDFDCAIGTFRSPARFRLTDESSLAGYAMNRSYEVWCSAPMAGPRRDVCVQLVPRVARSIENPLQPCNNTMGRHRLEYNYYRQMPRVDNLSPAVGLYEGGTDVVVSGKNFPDNTTFPGFPEVLCKFDIYILEGRRIDNTSVVCESPAVVYHCNSSAVGCNSNDSLEVSVTLSFNAGRDWSFT